MRHSIVVVIRKLAVVISLLMMCNLVVFVPTIAAGFRGKTRPNLLRQETTSIMCALRILYHMLADEERMQSDSDVVERRLLQLVNGGLEYFLQFTSEVHREAWTPVLLLMFVRMLQLQSDQVSLQ